MHSLRPLVRLTTLGILLVAVTGCRITWREPVLQPLNTNRFYDAELDQACDAVEQVVAQYGLDIRESQRQESACLVDTDFKVFSDTGENPINHLDRVAFTGPGGFIGGRYTLTITGRDVRDGGTRVKVVSRVEGYVNEEFGYQVLRSNGRIEETMFAAIGNALGETPVEAR